MHFNEPDMKIVRLEMSVKVSFLESLPTGTVEPVMTVPKSAIKNEGGST